MTITARMAKTMPIMQATSHELLASGLGLLAVKYANNVVVILSVLRVNFQTNLLLHSKSSNSYPS